MVCSRRSPPGQEKAFLQALSGKERKTKKRLDENKHSVGMQELIEEVIIPTENVLEVKKGQQKITEKKLWPGYILIKMELMQ